MEIIPGAWKGLKVTYMLKWLVLSLEIVAMIPVLATFAGWLGWRLLEQALRVSSIRR